MRRLIPALLVVLIPAFAHAVTSRVRYEEANGSINGGDGYKTYDNLTATLAWGESYIMMSYPAMYRATGDRLYLDRLADHADHVYLSRDDVAGVTEYNGKSSPCWRVTKYQPNNEPYCYVVHSGMLTYPMADFAVLVYADESLWDKETYDGSTYKEKADLLVARVEETVAFHDFQYKSGPGAGQGHYVFDPGAVFLDHAGQEVPYNQQNAMGRALVALHLATGKAEYKTKAETLAMRFQAGLTLSGSSYLWNYWGGAYKSPGEDISHAAINADFARLCGENGIVFNEQDLARFGNTFFNHVYINSSALHDNVGGGGTNGSSYKPQCGRWLHLSPYHPSVYTIVRNIYDGYETQTGSGSVVLGFAHLALFEPVVRPHFFYYVDWDDGGDHMEASAQNANILATPPEPSQRAVTRISYASSVPVSAQQWNDDVYSEVARLASTGGSWRSLFVPYHPSLWHPYWQGGALFQLTESPFSGVKVKKPEPWDPPMIITDQLSVADPGVPWSHTLEGEGEGPFEWKLLDGPENMVLDWQSGVLSWDDPAPPGSSPVLLVRLANDYGFDEVELVLDVLMPIVEPSPEPGPELSPEGYYEIVSLPDIWEVLEQPDTPVPFEEVSSSPDLPVDGASGEPAGIEVAWEAVGEADAWPRTTADRSPAQESNEGPWMVVDEEPGPGDSASGCSCRTVGGPPRLPPSLLLLLFLSLAVFIVMRRSGSLPSG